MLGCPWQRCTIHFLREALGHAWREQQPMLAALISPIFNAASDQQAHELLGEALERLRSPLPKIHDLLEDAEDGLLAFYAFATDHHSKLVHDPPARADRLSRGHACQATRCAIRDNAGRDRWKSFFSSPASSSPPSSRSPAWPSSPPMAVRIDRDGRVSSRLAAGVQAVFELLGASVTSR